MRYVSLYPRTEAAGMREAITEGVRVRASVLFLPDRSYQFRNRMQYFYTYRSVYFGRPILDHKNAFAGHKINFIQSDLSSMSLLFFCVCVASSLPLKETKLLSTMLMLTLKEYCTKILTVKERELAIELANSCQYSTVSRSV